MPDLIADFIADRTEPCPIECALLHRDRSLGGRKLQTQIVKFARGFHSLDIEPGEKLAVYLPRQFESFTGFFGATHAHLYRDTLLRIQNGKLDLAGLKKRFHDFFQDEK